MPLTTTVPAVMERLFQKLSTAPDLADVQVEESDPGNAAREALVYLGKVTSTSVTVPVMRAVRVAREERYMVSLFIRYTAAGTNSKDTRESAFAIYATIENLLVTDPTLGVQGVITCLPFSFDESSAGSDNGWQTDLHVELEVYARLY